MSRAESIRRKGGRIYYFQSGSAEEQSGRVSVHITAIIATPKRVSRSIHLHIPAEQYGYFLDTLQAQTQARFRHGRREYDRQTTLLRAFCRPEECRVKTPVRQSIPGVLREKMERVYRIRADTLVCCGCVLLKLHGKAQMATRWKALETALNDTLRL